MQKPNNKDMAFGLFCILALGGLLLMLPGLMTWSAFDRSIQTLSALGTVGAVWWAVMHSNGLKEQQLKREYDSACLHAASLADPLVSSTYKIKILFQAARQLTDAVNEENEHEHLEQESFRQRVNQIVNGLRKESLKPIFEMPAHDIEILVPLNGRAAFKLQAACSQMRVIRKMLGEKTPGSTTAEINFANLRELLGEIESALNALQFASNEVVKAARTGASLAEGPGPFS